MKIIFYKGSDIINKIILCFSRGGYSHVAIQLTDKTVIGSNPFRGVLRYKSCIDRVKPKSIIDIYEVDTTPEQDTIIEQFLFNQLGKGYDYWSIIGFLFHTTKEKRKQSNRWMCSELVLETFKQANITLLDRVESWKISPTILSYNTKMKFVDRIII